jgi:hypothetical protein
LYYDDKEFELFELRLKSSTTIAIEQNKKSSREAQQRGKIKDSFFVCYISFSSIIYFTSGAIFYSSKLIIS